MISTRMRFLRFSIVAALLLGGVVLGYSIWSCNPHHAYRKKIERGNQIILLLEQYRAAHARYPASLRDIGIAETMEGPVYYERRGDDAYLLWFGTSLGESGIYDSKTKQWDIRD